MKPNEKKNFGFLDIIKYPVITEKTTHLSSNNQVTFEVMVSASKQHVKEAIESVFGVSVKAVNTLVKKGKKKTFKGKVGFQVDRKMAIVTLNEGQQLDFGSGN